LRIKETYSVAPERKALILLICAKSASPTRLKLLNKSQNGRLRGGHFHVACVASFAQAFSMAAIACQRVDAQGEGAPRMNANAGAIRSTFSLSIRRRQRDEQRANP
jgi:hypothetical protein